MQIPTLDECRFHAAKIGLVPIEAEKFFCYFESNGWKVGKNPMKNWQMAMRGWQLRCQPLPGKEPKPIDKVILLKEWEEIISKMRSLKNSYDAHQTWDDRDIRKWKELRARRIQIRTLLGMEI